jgi:methyl-accepting chemotaxis protein
VSRARLGHRVPSAVEDLASRVDEAESSLADLASRLDDLESGVSLTDLQSSIEEAQAAAETAAAAAAAAQSTADDVAQAVGDLCFELSQSDVAPIYACP